MRKKKNDRQYHKYNILYNIVCNRSFDCRGNYYTDNKITAVRRKARDGKDYWQRNIHKDGRVKITAAV